MSNSKPKRSEKWKSFIFIPLRKKIEGCRRPDMPSWGDWTLFHKHREGNFHRCWGRWSICDVLEASPNPSYLSCARLFHLLKNQGENKHAYIFFLKLWLCLFILVGEGIRSQECYWVLTHRKTCRRTSLHSAMFVGPGDCIQVWQQVWLPAKLSCCSMKNIFDTQMSFKR